MMLQLDTVAVLDLYSNVLSQSKQLHNVTDRDIRVAMQNIIEVYKPNPTWRTFEKVDVANYNEADHRCAYLHKYAACHTGLVFDMLMKALVEAPIIYQLIGSKNQLNICSLGGGPGSDIIAVLYAFSALTNNLKYSISIVDCMIGWCTTFDTVIRELRSGLYGSEISLAVSPNNISYCYLYSDLLGPMQSDVNKAIANADFITMVKFISAAACKDSHVMVRKIFNSMKPGALILFIDNAAGGFHELVQNMATELNFQSVYGPLCHELYKNENFSVRRFNYTSLSETRVAVQIWRKVPRLRSGNKQSKTFKPKASSFRRAHKLSNLNHNVNHNRPRVEQNSRTPSKAGQSAKTGQDNYQDKIMYPSSNNRVGQNYFQENITYPPSRRLGEWQRPIPSTTVYQPVNNVQPTYAYPSPYPSTVQQNQLNQERYNAEEDDCCSCCTIS